MASSDANNRMTAGGGEQSGVEVEQSKGGGRIMAGGKTRAGSCLSRTTIFLCSAFGSALVHQFSSPQSSGKPFVTTRTLARSLARSGGKSASMERIKRVRGRPLFCPCRASSLVRSADGKFDRQRVISCVINIGSLEGA